MLSVSTSLFQRAVRRSESLVCSRNISKIIVMKGLPKRTSEADVTKLVKAFGVVEKVSLLDNKRTNSSLTGIVVFKDIDSAIRAVDLLDETTIFGRPRSIVFGATDRSSKRVTFVKKSPPSAEVDKVEKLEA